MKVITVGVVLVLSIVYLEISDATICQPLSIFKLDCNLCKCSSSGREYSCTQLKCEQRNQQEFYDEEDKDGYVLLKPKKDRFDFDDGEDDFVLKNKLRRPRVILPYINDELPSSKEDNEIKDGNNDEFARAREDLEEARHANIEDISLENDSEDWEETNSNFM